jgi:hypothetical protein
MTDEFDLAEAFDGLSPEQARDLATRLRGTIQKEVQTFKQPQPPSYDEAEAAEIAAIQVRGPNYALQKRNIKARYSALRNQPAPVVDPEIEKVKDDPRELMRLYQSRIAKIDRRDPMSLHRKTEIAAPFREKGLNV